jgi:hypothetical protein
MMRRIRFHSVLGMTVTALPFIALSGCVATAPSPYYAAHPSTVVVMPASEPDTTTHYVYGEINSTNETHITSNSTVHIISNHPLNGAPPPVAGRTGAARGAGRRLVRRRAGVGAHGRAGSGRTGSAGSGDTGRALCR